MTEQVVDKGGWEASTMSFLLLFKTMTEQVVGKGVWEASTMSC